MPRTTYSEDHLYAAVVLDEWPPVDKSVRSRWKRHHDEWVVEQRAAVQQKRAPVPKTRIAKMLLARDGPKPPELEAVVAVEASNLATKEATRAARARAREALTISDLQNLIGGATVQMVDMIVEDFHSLPIKQRMEVFGDISRFALRLAEAQQKAEGATSSSGGGHFVALMQSFEAKQVSVTSQPSQ